MSSQHDNDTNLEHDYNPAEERMEKENERLSSKIEDLKKEVRGLKTAYEMSLKHRQRTMILLKDVHSILAYNHKPYNSTQSDLYRRVRSEFEEVTMDQTAKA